MRLGVTFRYDKNKQLSASSFQQAAFSKQQSAKSQELTAKS
jgi:hypothetical protein